MTMRTAEYDEYGTASVMQVRMVPKPVQARGEALVRVHASTVNPIDTIVRSGLLKFKTGKNFPKRTGIDFAGQIVDPGTDPKGFKVGDQVWGVMPLTVEKGFGQGSSADFVTISTTRIAKSPGALDPTSAAALSSVGAVAIIALRDKAHLKAGERILIRGGAGGVGTIAIQLAKHLGAHVTVMGSAKDLAYLKDLGADTVLDYRITRPATLPKYDVILDLAGTELAAYRRHLTPQGRMFCLAVKGLGALAYFQFSKIYGSKRVTFFSAAPMAETMAQLTTYVDSDALRPIIDSVYPMEDIALAQASVEAGGGRGKRVLLHKAA